MITAAELDHRRARRVRAVRRAERRRRAAATVGGGDRGGADTLRRARPAAEPRLPRRSCVWRRQLGIDARCAVAYYPWIEVPALPTGSSVAVPPCGHVIGSWARLDASAGVHHAPTGQPLLGIDGLAAPLAASDQRAAQPRGHQLPAPVPGPEARVWGASTLVRRSRLALPAPAPNLRATDRLDRTRHPVGRAGAARRRRARAVAGRRLRVAAGGVAARRAARRRSRSGVPVQ